MPEDLEAIFGESVDIESYEVEDGDEIEESAGLGKGSRPYLLGLVFIVGLLLGWLAIGWWLWPVKWANSTPCDLHPEYQRTFVSLVAESYWQTGNLSRVREALAGWDDEDLVDLIAAMENEASTHEERQQLAALAQVLELPEAEASLFTSLLAQEVLLVAALLAASPSIVAVALFVYPRIKNGAKRPGEGLEDQEEQLEEALEHLLAQGELEGELGGELEGELEGEQPEEQEEELSEGQPGEPQEGEEDEEEDEEEIILGDEDIESTQDVFLSLFGEDDTEVTKLEELCKTLEDVNADDLLENSRMLADQLQRSNLLQMDESMDGQGMFAS